MKLAIPLITCLAILSGCAAHPTRQADASQAVRRPPSTLRARFANGDATLDVGSGTNLHGSTNANLIGLSYDHFPEVGAGGGIELDYFRSGHKLLQGTFPGSDSGTTGFDLFGYAAFGPGTDRFRIPFRVGVEVVANNLETNGSSALEWYGLGLALGMEPEFDFFRQRNSALSAYGGLRVGAGKGTADGAYDTPYRSFVGEVGLRWQRNRWLIAAGFTSRTIEYEESDPIGNRLVENTEFGMRGLFIDVGIRW